MDCSAIVTGGTGGLGSAVVTRLLDDGWRVIVPWVVESELERVQPRDRLELIQADLFDADAVSEVVESAGADASAAGPRARQSRRRLCRRTAGRRNADRGLREAVPAEPTPHVSDGPGDGPQDDPGRRRSIACVGTRAALQPFSGAAGYIASKAAVIAFAKAVAVEYRDDGVRCNTILPSVIDTPANRASMPDADHDRWVKPAQIAGVISFLLSADSPPTSGAAIPVYGRA